MFVGSWLSGAVVEHYAASATQHNWPAIWMVPAIGAAGILVLFLVTFADRSKSEPAVDNGLDVAAVPVE